jgi:hypothetical protein
MLRAALEHGFALELWWDQVKESDDRRAVLLQTLTSYLAPARRRAMQYLALVPDSAPSAIPIRVANVIAEETDPAVQQEGIRLLEKRAHPDSEGHWASIVYSEAVEGTLVELAAHAANRQVADLAARTLARIRSMYGITRLAKLAESDTGAFNALVAARDEIDSLPPTVPAGLRQRVFLILSWRQLTADILGLVWRYASAALACGVMSGVWAYWQFDDQGGLLAAQRLGNALAVGALYGLLTGFGIFAAVELASRLKAWNPFARAGLAWAVGTLLTTAGFVLRVLLFQFYTPIWQSLFLASIVFVAGFAIASAFTRRASIRSLAGAIGVMLAVYYSMKLSPDEPLLMLMFGADDADSQNIIFSSGIGIAVGLITFLPEWIGALWRMRQNPTKVNTQLQVHE